MYFYGKHAREHAISSIGNLKLKVKGLCEFSRFFDSFTKGKLLKEEKSDTMRKRIYFRNDFRDDFRKGDRWKKI